jgi:uncharacterized damage-inducible protein DinB
LGDFDEIVGWFERVYARTLEVARSVPPEKLDWRPAPGEFSAADIIRHIAATEVMNVARIGSKKLVYGGHSDEYARTYPEVIAYLETCHAEAVNMLQNYGLDALTTLVPTNQGDIAGWRVIVGMLEHEIHHRSQLCSYLTQMGITPPPLFGIYVEDLPK